MAGNSRSDGELVDRLRTHLRLLEQYIEHAFVRGDDDFVGEVAGKLRLLVYRSRTCRPLLLDLVRKHAPDLKLRIGPRPHMRSGPKEGDELTLEEFLNLPAIAQRTSEGLEKLTKLKLIALLAHKMGVHEDPTLPEVLRNIIDFEFSINGVRPWKMEIEMTARAVLGVGQRFLGKIE